MNNGKVNGITIGVILIIVTLVLCCLVISISTDVDTYAPFAIILSFGSLVGTILIADTAKKYLWKDDFRKEFKDEFNNDFGITHEQNDNVEQNPN